MDFVEIACEYLKLQQEQVTFEIQNEKKMEALEHTEEDDYLEKEEEEEILKRLNASESSVDSSVSAAASVVSKATDASNTKKGVTFALQSSSSSSSNHVRSTEELQEELTQLRIDLSSEKVLRKKKEKNMLKLAKQLNVHTNEISLKETQIKKLSVKNESLQHEFEAMQSCVSQLTHAQEKTRQEHHDEMTLQLSKYRHLCREADTRISELQKTHARQCDEFRRQILQINLESDALRTQLAKVQKNPRNDFAKEDFSNHDTTHRVSNNSSNPPSSSIVSLSSLFQENTDLNVTTRTMSSTKALKEKSRTDLRNIALFAASLILLFAIIIPTLSSLNKHQAFLCSPVIPGTTFATTPKPTTTTTIYASPWWAPTYFKQRVFHSFCYTSIPVEVSFSHQNDLGNLFIKNLINNKRVLLRKNVKLVTIYSNYIHITNRRNKKEILPAPWSSDKNKLN